METKKIWFVADHGGYTYGDSVVLSRVEAVALVRLGVAIYSNPGRRKVVVAGKEVNPVERPEAIEDAMLRTVRAVSSKPRKRK